MDVIRIRLQTQPELKGVGDAIKNVYREGGMRTFYKGYTPAMLSLSPFIAINFATMDTLKNWYYGPQATGLSKKQLQQKNPGVILWCVLLLSSKKSFNVHYSLGAISGLVAQTCCYPLDTGKYICVDVGMDYLLRSAEKNANGREELYFNGECVLYNCNGKSLIDVQVQ